MTMESTLIQFGAAGAAMALLMALVAVVSLRRTRARRAQPTDEPALEAPEAAVDAEVEAEVEAEAEAEPAPESAEVVAAPVPVPDEDDGTLLVRALRAQVRALEQALEALPADALTAPQPPQVSAGHDAAAAYRRQVALTIRALSGQADQHESPQRTLARVAAAIERLDAPAGLTRPAIPAAVAPAARQAEGLFAGQPAGTIAQSAAPRALTSVAVAEPATQPGEVAATPLEESVEIDGASTATETVDTAEVERQLVRPVPPPAPAGPKRTKRRLRRSAA